MRRWILLKEVRHACRALGRLLTELGKLHLQPTVVGRSKWNESVQKLKNGQVAG